MATTTHWAPNSRAVAVMSAGSAIAAVLTATLSAPARSRRRAASTVRTPPPLVNGMNTCSAVPRAMAEAFQTQYGVIVRQLWGMTETTPMGVIATPTPNSLMP